MNKKEFKLYNILLTIWILIFWPLWLAVITAPYLYFFLSRLLY